MAPKKTSTAVGGGSNPALLQNALDYARGVTGASSGSSNVTYDPKILMAMQSAIVQAINPYLGSLNDRYASKSYTESQMSPYLALAGLSPAQQKNIMAPMLSGLAQERAGFNAQATNFGPAASAQELINSLLSEISYYGNANLLPYVRQNPTLYTLANLITGARTTGSEVTAAPSPTSSPVNGATSPPTPSSGGWFRDIYAPIQRLISAPSSPEPSIGHPYLGK